MGYGNLSGIMEIKPNIITCKKPYRVRQQVFHDRLLQMQQYLHILHQYFNCVKTLDNDETKDIFVRAQPINFMKDFARAKISICASTIEDLLEFFIDLEYYDEYNVPRQQRNVHQNTPMEVKSFVHSPSNSQNY